ncbi:MAG: DNA methylase [Lachnospiraceae bacterium]
MKNRTYLAIDFKSFYASVECIERNLDPLTTNLVVADISRTEKTICLAVSPSLKAYGISGRARLFEVVQKVREVNAQRQQNAPGRAFMGSSFDDLELKSSPQFALDYIAATPRMALYIDYSTRIYHIYLKYIAPEDIHVYSIDEVFMDVTDYLNTYGMTVRELATKIIQEVRQTTGITAAAGIGTNLYLCKIAMDIQAKHIQEDENGVLIAELDEMSYRHLMWTHRPLTDFWRIGRGYARKLEEQGLMTMGDIAKCSLGRADEYYNEDLLYKMFGINAELLIDHAWGWEPCTIADVKAYKPSTNCIGSGQVLQFPYSFDKARLVVREMTDLLSLDLVDRGLVTDQLVLTIGYDIDNLKDPDRKRLYHGQITTDRYGRSVPKAAHGTKNFSGPTSSTKQMLDAATELFEEIVNKNLLIRRINISVNRVIDESAAHRDDCFEQLNLFTDYAAEQSRREEQAAELAKEKKVQKALLLIKHKYGKNAVLRGMNLEEGATAPLRNRQIGGHKA